MYCVFDVPFHLLYPVKSLTINDGLQVHRQLPTVLFFFARQEIRCVGLLH